MSNAITRCPKCHTSFRVTEEILSSAHGSVRCGSCLMIFNARDNLIPRDPLSGETSAEKKLAENVSEQNTAEQDDELIHDDALLEVDIDDAIIDSDEDFDENIFVANHASKADINLFERRIKDEDNRELENADLDEAWALSLLDDDIDEDEVDEEVTDIQDEPPQEKRKPNPFLIIEDEEELERASKKTDSDSYETNVYHAESAEFDYDTSEELDENYDNFTPRYQHARTDFLEAIEPEPLELAVPYRPQLWQHGGFWLGLSVLAALTLLFQLAYFNFDNFSRQQTLRPYYKSACDVLGCKLPTLEDLSKLRVQNMVVMDHPKFSDMLLVDATLINQADFEQAFPVLQLTFTDLDNKIVSKMLFDPQTYVGGELSGRSVMPTKHPIHITLELADPGKDALNYQIAVVKP